MATDDNLIRIVSDRIEKLRMLGFDEVRLLPKVTTELLLSGKIKVAQYHDELDSGEHLVVVQALRDRLTGLTTEIKIDGFVMEAGGSRRALREEETWPFL